MKSPPKDVITVRLKPSAVKDRTYKVIIGRGILGGLGDEMSRMDLGECLFLITDHIVKSYYGEEVVASLKGAGFRNIAVGSIPQGEGSKDLDTYRDLCLRIGSFEDGKFHRPVIIVLGGGVIGDLGGFVAATYRRGVDYIQVPTTLLAMVDSGLGGKVGIDLQAKNQLGAFHQPVLVYVDVDVLETLPEREVRCGLAEVIKYGLIADPEIFERLESKGEKVFQDLDEMMWLIKRCYTIKARIVERDERDRKGIRMILNFGHTVGHAVEAAKEMGIRHGEAVAVGMICASRISERMGLIDEGTVLRIENTVNSLSAPFNLNDIDSDTILKYIAYDKKAERGKNRFVLLEDIGRPIIQNDVPVNLVRECIEETKKIQSDTKVLS